MGLFCDLHDGIICDLQDCFATFRIVLLPSEGGIYLSTSIDKLMEGSHFPHHNQGEKERYNIFYTMSKSRSYKIQYKYRGRGSIKMEVSGYDLLRNPIIS